MKKLILSNSRVSCFRDCRLKYHLKYDERLIPKKKSDKLLAGSGVHKGIAVYFKMVKEGIKVDEKIEDVRNEMKKVIKKYFADEKKKVAEKDIMGFDEYVNELKEQEEMGLCMVDNFLKEWNDKVTRMFFNEIVEIETPHTVEVYYDKENDVMVEYIFIPDMIVRMNNKLWDFSLKTTKSIEYDSLRRDDQGRGEVWAYERWLKEQGKDEEVQGIIYFLMRKQKDSARVKNPLTGKSPIFVTRQELKLFEEGFIGIAKEMTKGYSVYRSPSLDCLWKCPYKDICGEENEELKKAEFEIKKGERDGSEKGK